MKVISGYIGNELVTAFVYSSSCYIIVKTELAVRRNNGSNDIIN